MRWAAIESVKILPTASRIGAIREQVAHRRGNRNIGAVAAARRQLELVFFGLRDAEIDLFTGLAQRRLTHDAGYTAIQQIPGIGPVLAAVFVAEIGEA